MNSDVSRSLSDLGDRSENLTGRGQILSFLKVNSCSIDRKKWRNMNRTGKFAVDLS